jgi:two-component system sensor histidine kinase BarA
LIADDNDFNVIVLQEILKLHNLESDSAADGLQAVQKVKKSLECCSYKLIFMDLNMPFLDGLQATGRIKEMLRS